ncbi:sugar ABC transporter permease [Alkalihalobacillus sp. LMS39]|uniref:carbohydrate ABC transporter permease n=1 Tax=Alkalihalobacillus sp. LMS39 TaxID=2924032 RepID=UPI001FB442E2|nr:sugar ABC transporter permease [Alkalihalobacillus sp. LMS39]UOE93568.1 sugar ABC transporter permease [Alkalihalobacillus sp. LMS39]
MNSQTKKESRIAYLFILPMVIQFVIFTSGPMLYSMYISLTDWNILQSANFVGLSNYISIFTDSRFYQSLWNTGVYLLGVPIGLFLSLIIAIWMNQGIRGTSIYRMVYYLPAISSIVAITILWQWIYNTDYGLMNYFLGFFGIDGPNWIGNEKYIKPAIIIMGIWKGIGVTIIFYLAALQSVPKALYEAAEIDGANFFHKFRYVTVPLITPITFFLVVTGIINSLQIFVEIQIMVPDGGANYAAASIVFYLWQKAFVYYEMGYASALAWVLGFIMFVVTFIQFKLSSKWVHE